MLYMVVGVAVVTWLLLWSTTPPPRLLGVYSRPGFWYWLKVVIFYIIVKVRRLGNKTGGSGAEVGYGVKSYDNPELMECVQPLSDHPKAIDAVYFNGANESGHYLVAATARRPKGVINGLLYLRVPGVGLLQLPKMPDTMMFGDGEQFAAEGLRITPVKPMAVWRIQYEGAMKMKDSPLSRLKVKLDVQWISQQPCFDFDTDMNARALARSIAREPWSRKYFQGLREAHQSHYEQMGRIEGTVVVDEHPYILRLDSMRDHSYGYKREWKLMHRYGLHMFATQDGLQGNVGIICQPATCTQLEMGYISEGGKVTAVSSVNLSMWQHGENGHAPSDYAFSFVAGGKEYVVEVFVLEAPEFYIGWEWETRVVERMATFRVNGRKGWGLAEWDYRHHGGRPRAYGVTDPAWTADLVKEAEEERVMVKSDDDPQCVVHYHGLVDDKTSRIILLSDRSYSKLIDCKNIRTELGGEAYHDQCETIPVPGYDEKKDGYHRPCYMKFIKIKIDKKVTKHENYSKNDSKTNGENYSENENKTEIEDYPESKSKIKDENNLENTSKTEDETYSEIINKTMDEKTENDNYSNNESKIKNENYFGNKSKIEDENYSERESKTKDEYCSENQSKSKGEHYSKDDGQMKDYSDNESKTKDENYSESDSKVNDENFPENESTTMYEYHSQNQCKIDDENYSDNQSKAKNENYFDNQSKAKDENYSDYDETRGENYSENEDKNYSESDITHENFSETENNDENQGKTKHKYNSENQSKTKAGNYSVKQSKCENCNGLKKRHRTYMTEDK